MKILQTTNKQIQNKKVSFTAVKGFPFDIEVLRRDGIVLYAVKEVFPNIDMFKNLYLTENDSKVLNRLNLSKTKLLNKLNRMDKKAEEMTIYKLLAWSTDRLKRSVESFKGKKAKPSKHKKL